MLPGGWDCCQGVGIVAKGLGLLPGGWDCCQGVGIVARGLGLLPRGWDCCRDFIILLPVGFYIVVKNTNNNRIYLKWVIYNN